MIKIYDSFSRKLKPLPAPPSRPLHLFVCGPTVYDEAHIGHARTALVFDAFVRFLRARGMKIFYLQNITNVDDKIIERAHRERVRPLSLAGRYEREYLRAMKTLGVISVDRYARASDHIPAIVKQVETLMEKGYAYRAKDGYYFDISLFKDYGKLAGRTALQAEDAVSRVDEGVGKRNKGDFALWKFAKPGEPSWHTRLGVGRPGWHIEDTAITETFFGPQYDVHGGGVDLKFPHHEAEIAQQEAASGEKPFVKIWMHTGHLLVGREKMSKSKGNFIAIRDFLATEHPATFRYLALSRHYRSPVNYTPTLAEQSRAALATLTAFGEKLSFVERKGVKGILSRGVRAVARATEQAFTRALENDFNTPDALSHLFTLAARYQKNLWELTRSDAKELHGTLKKLLGSLGFTLAPGPSTPPSVRALAEERELFRRNKQFAQADALRAKIDGLGYTVDDTPLGPFITPHASGQKAKTPPARS